MLKVGITGGIGSGKTTVSKIFQQLNIPVYFSDDEAKKLMNEDEEIKINLIKNFGNEVFIQNELNRNFLASIVFNNNQQLKILNNIIHPIIISKFNKWAENQNSEYIIKEAALLFESGSFINLDFVIGVSCSKNIRLERIQKRDNIDILTINKKINNQIDEDIKMKLCDFIINNNEDELIIPQVLNIHNILLNKNKIL